MAQSRLALLHRSGFGSQNSSNFLSCSLANRTGKRLAGFFSSSSSHRERPVRENSCWRYDSNARGQRCVALRSGTGGGAGQDQASRIRAWQAKRQESFGIRYQNANVLNPWKLGELVKSSGESVQCIVETGLGPGYSFQDVERDLKNCEGSKKAFIKPRQNCKRRSGGTGIIIPENLATNVVVDDKYNELDWMVPFKVHLKERGQPLVVIVCYIPGSGKFFGPNMFNVLAEVFLDMQKDSSGVIAVGDLNVQIGDHPGCNSLWVAENYPRRAQNKTRKNAKRLDPLLMCGAIVNNGRTDGDLEGKPTNYHRLNSSQGTEIDYVLTDLKAFPDVLKLGIGSVNRSISSHVPMQCTISKHSFNEAPR